MHDFSSLHLWSASYGFLTFLCCVENVEPFSRTDILFEIAFVYQNVTVQRYTVCVHRFKKHSRKQTAGFKCAKSPRVSVFRFYVLGNGLITTHNVYSLKVQFIGRSAVLLTSSPIRSMLLHHHSKQEALTLLFFHIDFSVRSLRETELLQTVFSINSLSTACANTLL